MSRRSIARKLSQALLLKRCTAGLVVAGVLLGVTAGCGGNDPVVATGVGLKKKLKNREETEIKSRRFVQRPQKSRA
jgi:hypothetical protein